MSHNQAEQIYRIYKYNMYLESKWIPVFVLNIIWLIGKRPCMDVEDVWCVADNDEGSKGQQENEPHLLGGTWLDLPKEQFQEPLSALGNRKLEFTKIISGKRTIFFVE